MSINKNTHSLRLKSYRLIWVGVFYIFLLIFLSTFIVLFREVNYWIETAEWNLLKVSDLLGVYEYRTDKKGFELIMNWLLSIPYSIAAPIVSIVGILFSISFAESYKGEPT